jgi:type I restriction enzyme M protein
LSYKDIPEFCKSASFEEIEANDFSLVPSKYIEFVDKDSGIDFDTEMKRIQKDFKTLLQEEKESHKSTVFVLAIEGIKYFSILRPQTFVTTKSLFRLSTNCM